MRKFSLYLKRPVNMSNKVVVIFSGGMDSFTVLNRALKDGKEVYALTFDYGQKHVKEIACASKVCEQVGLSLIHISEPTRPY